MMDLKEIIKWFIPCFHILQFKKIRKVSQLTLVCLFLFFNLCTGSVAKVNNDSDIDISENSITVNNAKKVHSNFSVNVENNFSYDQNEHLFYNQQKYNDELNTLEDISTGRTFGRPLKKVMQALLPLVFQMGMAATWAVVAALVGIKTLAVALLILKLLLMAGAAKVGSLFSSKHHSQRWEQHQQQKEIHLHIHNNPQHGSYDEHEHISPWSRDGTSATTLDTKNVFLDPYSVGPQTIRTPYGNYIKVEPSSAVSSLNMG